MSKTKQRLWLAFMIVLYIIIACVGFGAAYYIKTVLFSQPSQSQTQATTIKTVTAPIGWKTFSNSSLNLSFSYPPTDTIQTKEYGFGVSSATVLTSKGSTDFQILFLPKTLASTVGQDFDSYYTMPNNTTKVIKNPMSQNSTTEKFTKLEDRTINSLRALDYQSIASNAQPNTSPEIGTFIEAGSNLVLISTGKNNKASLEKMVGTFRYPL
ncbi:MAG TPA: hypothetical protein VLF93_04380 [Candidatus Saccharimonadales bacterium]|nr:hypothetical protein [Candidatus Saccharimonadales bacterium]